MMLIHTVDLILQFDNPDLAYRQQPSYPQAYPPGYQPAPFPPQPQPAQPVPFPTSTPT